MARRSKKGKEELIGELSSEFRINSNQEHAFDNVAAARLGVNRTDLNGLDIIQRMGPITAGDLATETGLTTGAVTAVIDRLEQAGYARRVRDSEDRRRVMVEVTDEFYDLAEGIWAPMFQDWAAFMNRFTVDQLELIVRFMHEGNEVARRHIDRVRDDT
jgi:DNA-binding MarR family transcriptional regulator